MQGSSLSDDAVIAFLNAKFVPLYADVDAYGFPEEIIAIAKYKRVWQAFSKNKWGIATSAVVDSSGKRLLGESGSGFFWQWKTATNYYPDKFLDYLHKAELAGSNEPRVSPFVATMKKDAEPSK